MNGTEWQPSLLSRSKHLISIIPPSIGHASIFWHVDVQFDLDSQRTCVQLQSDTKRLVLIAIHGTAAAGLGGLALMHSLSVVPLPTLLRLPRNCASLCPTSVVSIYRLLSASTEKVCVHCSPSNKGAESSSWPISQKLTPNNVVVATSQN